MSLSLIKFSPFHSPIIPHCLTHLFSDGQTEKKKKKNKPKTGSRMEKKSVQKNSRHKILTPNRHVVRRAHHCALCARRLRSWQTDDRFLGPLGARCQQSLNRS